VVVDYPVMYDGDAQPRIGVGNGMRSVFLHEAAALPNFRGYRTETDRDPPYIHDEEFWPKEDFGGRIYESLEKRAWMGCKITHICFEVDG